MITLNEPQVWTLMAVFTASLFAMFRMLSARFLDVIRADIRAEVSTLRTEMHDGFGRVEGRIGGLEGRVDGIEKRMGGLEQRMDGLEHRMDRLEDRFERVDAKLERLDRDVQAVVRQVFPGREGA